MKPAWSELPGWVREALQKNDVDLDVLMAVTWDEISRPMQINLHYKPLVEQIAVEVVTTHQREGAALKPRQNRSDAA